MVRLDDVVAANALLVSLGAEDQLAVIATTSLERSIELQERIDRALHYAAQTPPSSAHARQMARILDGSITVDDVANEVRELDRPIRQQKAVESRPRRTTSGKGSADRTSAERMKIRAWLADKGVELGRGRIPQRYLDEYDLAMKAQRQRRREQRQQQDAPMSETMEGQLV
jgi:hypothetical protein